MDFSCRTTILKASGRNLRGKHLKYPTAGDILRDTVYICDWYRALNHHHLPISGDTIYNVSIDEVTTDAIEIPRNNHDDCYIQKFDPYVPFVPALNKQPGWSDMVASFAHTSQQSTGLFIDLNNIGQFNSTYDVYQVDRMFENVIANIDNVMDAIDDAINDAMDDAMGDNLINVGKLSIVLTVSNTYHVNELHPDILDRVFNWILRVLCCDTICVNMTCVYTSPHVSLLYDICHHRHHRHHRHRYVSSLPMKQWMDDFILASLIVIFRHGNDGNDGNAIHVMSKDVNQLNYNYISIKYTNDEISFEWQQNKESQTVMPISIELAQMTDNPCCFVNTFLTLESSIKSIYAPLYVPCEKSHRGGKYELMIVAGTRVKLSVVETELY